MVNHGTVIGLEKARKTLLGMALVLLTATVCMSYIFDVQAQVKDYVEWDTFAYIVVAPNPVGVNQQVIVQFRIDKVYPGRHAAWAFLGKLHRQNNQA
jgi:hypothetical protein